MSELARSARLGRYEQREILGEGAYGYRLQGVRSGDGRAPLKELRHVGPLSLAHFKLEFRTVQEVLEQARTLFSEQGWRKPRQAIAMTWPAFSDL